MKDFYSELGLDFGASQQNIAAAAAARPQCQEAANVLLNPLKKQVYDLAYLSMHEIGMLRAALRTQSPYWMQEQASFVRSEKHGKNIRICKQLRRSGRLFWILLILLILANVAILYFYHDKFPELKNLSEFSLFEKKLSLDSGKSSDNHRKSAFKDEDWIKDALKNISTYRGKYFKVFDSTQIKTVFNWEDAQKFCNKNYGQLAVITTLEENNFLFSWLEKISAKDVYFGLTDKKNEGIWVTSKGEIGTFFNWAPGEPNNEFGKEHYVMFYHRSPKGTWNDGNPGERFLFLCKWDSIDNFRNYEKAIGGIAQNIYTEKSKKSPIQLKEKNIIPKLNTGQTQKNVPGQRLSTPSLVGTYDGAYQTDRETVAFTLQVTQEGEHYVAIFEFYPIEFRGDPKTILGNTSGSVCYTTAPCQVGVVSQMS